MIVKNNEVFVGEISVSKLAKQHSTPLIVYDENHLTERAKIFVNDFSSEKYETQIAFATKAASMIGIIKILNSNGIVFEVVSPGEIFVVKKSGVDMKNVYYHGHSKTLDEIEFAMKNGVGTIVCDNFNELNRICLIANKMNKRIDILFRVNTNIDARSNIVGTAGDYSRYGEHITADFSKMVTYLKNNSLVNFRGFHSHVGTQILNDTPFDRLLETYSNFISNFKTNFPDVQFDTINFGGGFAANYTNENYDLSSFLKRFVKKIESSFSNFKNIKRLIIEPGRSMVAESAITIYSIDSVKHAFNGKNFIYANGGMTDNVNPAMYGDKHAFAINGKIGDLKEYVISGKCSDTSDTLSESYMLPDVEIGDLLVCFSTGAYTYSESSNYTSLLKPAVVMVNNQNNYEIVKRQSYDDLITNMID